MECVVCYATEEVERPCHTCKTCVCEACWYDSCKMFCPICDRVELNTPQSCRYCNALFHVKDINTCCACMSWVCDACSSNVLLHPCQALYRPHEAEGRALEDGLEVLTWFQKMDARAVDFAVLGNLAEGRVLAVKEGGNIVLMEACEDGGQASLFDRTAQLSAKVDVAYCIVNAHCSGCIEKINGLCHKLLTNCQESS